MIYIYSSVFSLLLSSMFNQMFRLSTAFCNHCKLLHLQKIIRFTLIDAHSDNSHTDTLTKKSCFLIQMWHYWLFPKIIHYKLQGWYLSMFYKFQSGNDIISWYQDSCTWGITYEWWNKAELIDLWCFVTVFGGSRRSNNNKPVQKIS